MAIANTAGCLVVVTSPMGIPGRFQRAASLRILVVQTKLQYHVVTDSESSVALCRLSVDVTLVTTPVSPSVFVARFTVTGWYLSRVESQGFQLSGLAVGGRAPTVC